MLSDRARRYLGRAFRLLCPECGQTKLHGAPFRLHPYCARCGLRYHRESGYLVGAVYLNVIVCEMLILGVFGVAFVIGHALAISLIPLLWVLAIVLPLLFFHHSRSLWLALDYLISPPVSADFPHGSPPATPLRCGPRLRGGG